MEACKIWEKVEGVGELYSPRTGHTVCSDCSFIYLFGGTDGTARKNDLYRFDPQNYVWHPISPIGNAPAARSGSQSVIHNGALYIFGGYTKKDGEYFNDIHRYTTQDNIWTEIQPQTEDNPDPRTDHSLIVYHNSMYVFGGYDGARRFNDLWEFNLETRRWRRVGVDQAPESRFGHTASLCKDKMIVFGGWNGHDTLNEVVMFSYTTFKWGQVVTSGFIAPRYRHTAVTIGNSMFVFGGVNKEQQRFSDVYEFNTVMKHWMRVDTGGPCPSPRTFHKGVIHDGFLYILGGFDGTRKNDIYRLFLQDFSPEEELETNPLFETKEEIGELHQDDEPFAWQKIRFNGTTYTARTGHCAISCNGIFYVFGGTDEQNRRNDIHAYNTEQKMWTQLPSLGQIPQARSGAKGVAYNRALFIFGGYTKKDGTYFNDLHRYDLETNYWTKIFTSGEMPSPRTDHTAVLYENSMYVFAGYDGKNRFNDLRECNLTTFEWTLLAQNGTVPLTRFGHTSVVHNHNMYIFGGWDGHDTLDDLYQYSFASNIWYELRRVIGPRPNPRYRHSCVVYDGSLFIFGGVDKQQQRYNDLYEFHIQKREWSSKRVTGQIPSSRTFHRALIHDDEMYILGGFDGRRQNDLYVIKLSSATEDKYSRPSSSFSRLYELEDEVPEQDYHELMKQNFILKQQIKELSERLQREEERDLCKV